MTICRAWSISDELCMMIQKTKKDTFYSNRFHSSNKHLIKYPRLISVASVPSIKHNPSMLALSNSCWTVLKSLILNSKRSLYLNLEDKETKQAKRSMMPVQKHTTIYFWHSKMLDHYYSPR